MEREMVWRLLLGQVMFFVFAMAIVFRSGGGAKGRVTLADEPLWILIPLRVNGLVLWGSIIWYLSSPSTFRWALVEIPWAWRVGGLVLALFMIPWMLWMFKHIGLNLTPTVQTRRDHVLITSGPYRWIRHPLYTFGGLLFVGLSIAIGSWLLWISIFLGGLWLRLRLPLEEQGLLDRFGEEYRDYREKTGAFFPKGAA